MKKLLCSLFFIGLFTTNIKAQYTWQALPNAPKSWRFDDMYFLNPTKGWAINPNYDYLVVKQEGEVFTTNDAGQTWQKLLDSSKTFIRCVGFADNLNGWFGNLGDSTITPDTNFMYHSADGGSTWAAVTSVTGPKPKGICGISVVNDSVVYAYGRWYGPAAIMKTTNKGQTWTSQRMDAVASGLVDGYFFNADTGYVVGAYNDKSLILSTFNGGATWQVRYQSIIDDEVCWKIVFPNRQIGYATIESHVFGKSTPIPDTTYFLKTTDGGLTWQRKIFKTGGYYDLQGVGFITDSIGWIGGDNQGKTYKTIDGGDHWVIDGTFGVATPPYSNYIHGYAMNRFRRFGDTLMYGAGNTIYKLKKGATGINDIRYSNSCISIYPNPFSHDVEVALNFAGLAGTPRLTLYNTLGQIVLKEKILYDGENAFELGTLAKGIYVYQVKTDQKIIATGKLVAD